MEADSIRGEKSLWLVFICFSFFGLGYIQRIAGAGCYCCGSGGAGCWVAPKSGGVKNEFTADVLGVL